MEFSCPVCGAPLERCERALHCPGGHSFDIARKNYVNLLMSNASSAKRHGDDVLMINARTVFLDRGYYRAVAETITRMSLDGLPEGCVIVDAGCGDGYYSANIARSLKDAGRAFTLFGVDISKAAVSAAARRCPEMRLCVASVSHIPLPNNSADLVLNIFSPLEAAEYLRILKPGGRLVRAVPLPEHLIELKTAVYERPYLNDEPENSLDGFETAAFDDVKVTAHLTSNEDIESLFKMTPYYYKTGRSDQQNLSELESLNVTVAIRVITYRKG